MFKKPKINDIKTAATKDNKIIKTVFITYHNMINFFSHSSGGQGVAGTV